MLRFGDWNAITLGLPPMVVVETSAPVLKIRGFFGDGPGLEFVVSNLVTAISDKLVAYQTVSQAVNRIRRDLSDSEQFKNDIDFLLSSCITLEQAALDIMDIFSRLGVYCGQRYLLYTFESILGDGSIVLRQFQTFEEFADEYAFSMQEGIFDDSL